MASGRRIAGAIRSLLNARSLHLECARALHESLLVPLLTYGSKIMMDNLRSLLCIRRMDKILNAWIRRLCRVLEGVYEKIDKDEVRRGKIGKQK